MSSRPRPSLMPPSTRASLAPSAAQNQLSSRALAEELEKTEQSITLALQEIDRNFSRANKIVGESILPVIEKHAVQSRNMWSGAAFWKQFLEAAANVSLSGYEEEQFDQQEEQSHELNAETENGHADYDSMTTPIKREPGDEISYENSEIFDSQPDIQSTPNVRRTSSPTKIPRPSSRSSRTTPRRDSEPAASAPDDTNDDYDVSMNSDKDDDNIPPPPRLSLAMGDNTNNDDSTVKLEEENSESATFERPSTPPHRPFGKNNNAPRSILRHQVLDKNWRIQATPFKKESNDGETKVKDRFSEFDSPEIKPPTLKSHIFDSPQDVSMNSPPQAAATPVRKKPAPQTPKNNKTANLYDSDSDSEMLPAGMSPPVTMHFSTHIRADNNNNLVKTPARQAAKTIVDDILRDVGGEDESESFASISQHYTRYKTDWSDDDDDL